MPTIAERAREAIELEELISDTTEDSPSRSSQQNPFTTSPPLDMGFTTKKKKKMKSRFQYLAEKLLKEKKERHDLFQKLLDEILYTIDNIKMKDEQKKHLRIKFQQHLRWFMEYGLKE